MIGGGGGGVGGIRVEVALQNSLEELFVRRRCNVHVLNNYYFHLSGRFLWLASFEKKKKWKQLISSPM